jgi:hypothetical protein
MGRLWEVLSKTTQAATTENFLWLFAKKRKFIQMASEWFTICISHELDTLNIVTLFNTKEEKHY